MRLAAMSTPDTELTLLGSIQRKVLWLSAYMVHHANHARPNPDGTKIGGHQASSSPLGLLAVTGASGSRASGTRTACRVCQASRAAACSACFFDRPSPAP